jgi:calcineurin-like phosphoesterase family protein
MIWFVSDHHFGHENIIKYESRPFRNASEMDSAMIHAHNMLVDEEDTVYILGDFTLLGAQEAVNYMWNLKGRIKILSNEFHHDHRWLTYPWIHDMLPSHVELLPPIHVIKTPYTVPGSKYRTVMVLCHYPFAVWDRKHYGSWHLYGHTHRGNSTDGLSLNVSIDNINQNFGGYRPISMEEVHKVLQKKSTML